MGYGGTRGYDQSRLIFAAEEDEGRRSDALNKQCQLAESGSNNAKKDVEELI